jgi:N-acetylglutamate synthase-like GNAT family acetyltransferase
VNSIRRAEAEDLPLLRRFLADAGLPNDDFEDSVQLYRLDLEGEPLGWAGLERHGSDALLRSVIVPPALRGNGTGRDLVRRVAEAARSQGVARIWLLTVDADRFFGLLGFRQAPREAAPAAIQSTSQFRTGCCSTASCMVLDLSKL